MDKLRKIIYIGIFSALWGALEITISSILHLLKLPFSGLIFSFWTVIILSIIKKVIPDKGSILYCALLVIFLKILSPLKFSLSPLVAIIIQSLLGELILYHHPIKMIQSITFGISIFIYNLLHPFFIGSLIFGTNMFDVYLKLINKIIGISQLEGFPIILVVFTICIIYIIAGIFTGKLAYNILNKLTLLKYENIKMGK